MDKPQARQAVGGFRGAALNQSRALAECILLSLIHISECILAYYVGTDASVSEVLHVAGEKCSSGASAEYVIQDIFRFLAH